MDDAPIPLVAGGLLALPGRAGCLVRAAASGVLAAGDDRGEVGTWDREGRRIAEARMRAAVGHVDLTDDGERAAFAAADGEILLLSQRGKVQQRLRGPAAPIVLFDRQSARLFVIDPRSGHTEVREASGVVTLAFDVPAPVAAAVAVPRTGGIAVVTAKGVVARVSSWGKLLWAGDFARPTSGLAVDDRGEELWIAILSRGVEVLHASSGSRLRAVDFGRPVACVALAPDRVAYGCPDGGLALSDRSGRLLAEGHAGRPVQQVALLDDQEGMFARLADGTARVFLPRGAPARADIVPALPRQPLWAGEIAPTPVLVAFAPSGRRAIATAADKHVVLCDEAGRLLHTELHQGVALALHCADVARVLTGHELRVITTSSDGVHTARQLTRFEVEARMAAFAPDGSTVACSDEVGNLRLLDGTTGVEVASARLPTGRFVTRIAATRVAAACETREGGVHLFGAGWDRPVSQRGNEEAARLGAATADGVVVFTSRGVHGYGWDGRHRWTLRTEQSPRAVFDAGAATIAVVGADAWVVTRDGRVRASFSAPEGEPCAASCAGEGRVSLASRVGRRVTIARDNGVIVRTETFDRAVLAVALSADGASAAVVLEGALLVLPRVADGALSRQVAPTT